MRLLITISIFLLTFSSYCQDTTFYYYFNESIELIENMTKSTVEFVNVPDENFFTINSLAYEKIADNLYLVDSDSTYLDSIVTVVCI